MNEREEQRYFQLKLTIMLTDLIGNNLIDDFIFRVTLIQTDGRIIDVVLDAAL